MLLTANIFQPLINVFQDVLTFFHNHLGVSWGFSIVLLTICVRLVLLPLTAKQFHSMRKLQHLQPQMKAIQQKYKADKQRQQEEMMKFYRENDVNPLGSCLPLVAQLPVFISLFYMLKKNLRLDICPDVQTRYQAHYAAVHHIAATASQALSQTTWCTYYPPHHYASAAFLLINDITNTAHGVTLVVLLLLYVGTQVLSTMLMSAPTMDQNQRRLMMFMPLIFVLFVIRFPAGLIVYWITTNAWTMGQQYTLKRLMGPPPVAPAPAVTVGAGPRSGSGGGGTGSGGPGKSPNGSGAASGASGQTGGGSGGLSGLLSGARSRVSGVSGKDAAGGEAVEPVAPAAPPRPPRKKKKRSGRRR
jgi:YidC/Oxa1 family membrane protein insertase